MRKDSSIHKSRTDLAMEAVEELRVEEEDYPSGISVNHYQEHPQIEIYDVEVETDDAAEMLGKPPGRYITLHSPGLMNRNRSLGEAISTSLQNILSQLLPEQPEAEILVVGLGNNNATPDALGPRIINLLMVTRHIGPYIPDDLKGNLRSVSAVSPGVLGTTGIESEEIIKGILNQINVDAVLTVDALAARSLDRLFTTVQLTDTGIHPGAGVGNNRTPLNEDTLQAPVIAMGVPTVVGAPTIARDTIDILVEQLKESGLQFYQLLDDMGETERAQLIHEVLSPMVGDMVVTPKEIDVIMRESAQILARGVNAALHPEWEAENMADYLV